jgi:hypothetical protein
MTIVLYRADDHLNLSMPFGEESHKDIMRSAREH